MATTGIRRSYVLALALLPLVAAGMKSDPLTQQAREVTKSVRVNKTVAITGDVFFNANIVAMDAATSLTGVDRIKAAARDINLSQVVVEQFPAALTNAAVFPSVVADGAADAEITLESSPTAAYTDWMPFSVYRDVLAKKMDEEYYPTKAEGTQTPEGLKYRAMFERRPAREFYFYHDVGVYEDYFQQRHRELSGQGFRLLWQHQFIDARGDTRYQVTWVRDPTAPSEVPRTGSPAVQPAPEGTSPGTLAARGAAAEREASQLLKEGRYADGLAKAREALALREQVLGPKHLDVAESLTTLAEFYRSMGQYADAERLHRRALAIREDLLSSDHAQVAQSLNNLAMLRNAQATYTEAETMLLRALDILERLQATMHGNYGLQAEILENLATAYRALGKVAEAEEARAKANLLWTLR